MDGAAAVAESPAATATRGGKSLCLNLVTISAPSTEMGRIYVVAFRITPAGAAALLNKLIATAIGEVSEKILA